MQLEYLAAGFFIGSARLGLSGVFHYLLGQDSPSIFEKLGHLITASQAIEMITVHKRHIIETHEDMNKSKSLVVGQDISMAQTHFTAAFGSLRLHHEHENVSRYELEPYMSTSTRSCWLSVVNALHQCLSERPWPKYNVYSGGSRISLRRGRQLPRGAANIWFCQISQKTAWNWKNLDP